MTTTVAPVRTPEQIEVDAAVLARVRAGIALLEERHGPDWVDRINLDVLDIADGACCVLGQLYGEYDDGLEKLGMLPGTPAAACGFIAAPCRAADWVTAFAVLTAAWRQELTPRVTVTA